MNIYNSLDQSYRSPRRAQAQRVLALTQPILQSGQILPAEARNAPETLISAPKARQSNNIRIIQDYSQPAAMACDGLVGVLIFGSSSKPGGGWLNGAKAQEEDISLTSTWGAQASLAPAGFYGDRKGLGGLGPDKTLLAKGYWLLNEHGQSLPAPRAAVFASVAAPNMANHQVAALPQSQRIDHLARRLVAAFTGWQEAGVDQVVLGAIGCGVFQWPPGDSALALRLALQHQRATGTSLPAIVLALPDPAMIPFFAQELGISQASTLTASSTRPNGCR